MSASGGQGAAAWAVLLVGVVLVGGALAGAVGLVARSASRASPHGGPAPVVTPDFPLPLPPPVAPALPPAAPVPADPSAPVSSETGHEATDLVEGIARAQQEANTKRPGARLVDLQGIRLLGGVLPAGATAGAGGPLALYTFEYSGRDPLKPPGADQVKLTVIVSLGPTSLTSTVIDGIAVHSDTAVATTRGGAARPVGIGGALCASRQAWAAAVASGVPANAVANLTLTDGSLVDSTGPLAWSIDIPGHPDLKRQVDAHTCVAIGPAGRSSPSKIPGASIPGLARRAPPSDSSPGLY